MVGSKLTPFQQEVLRAFFARTEKFFLTGGGALAGYHLGHRETHDLDLFATSDLLDDGDRALAAAGEELGATLEIVQTGPGFRRRTLRRGKESLIVDLVHDRAPQIVMDKPAIAGIRVDPPEEILANKLCAVLARGEIRDLVEVRALERAGFRVEDAMAAACRKDGGATPGQLAWVLSQIEIGDRAVLPGGVAPADLRAYARELQGRLTRLAFPK